MNNMISIEAEKLLFHGIVGKSKCMQDIYWKINLIAQNDVTVLLTGESGTGKELVARAIHNFSNRSSGPFFALNLGALSKDLIANELFGHEKGAFTGAVERSDGVFGTARDGTLFLDEISTLDCKSQVSLLRVLENQEYRSVGGKKPIKTNVRIITAANQNLFNMVKKGTFRKDLYYRLEVFTIKLPPLRKRKEDIPLLVNHFITLFNTELETLIRGIGHDALECCMNYKWPGNVRELKNTIQRAMILSKKSVITTEHLPEHVLINETPEVYDAWEMGLSLKELEKKYIERTLQYTCGNKVQAANMLAISRRALYNKIKAYNLC
jgi:DNA-binding NtrC family response regulator